VNSGIDKAIAPVLGAFYSLAIAFIAIAVISALAAHTIGGKTRQQRKGTFSMVAAICFLLYAVVFLPRILGKGA
jgi:hypothetical protein